MERPSSPGERQIQPLLSAKGKQESLATCAGILGCPFSHGPSMQNRGHVWGLGRARTGERRFQTSAGRLWALRTISARGAAKRPCRVSSSQNWRGSSSSPQKTCLSHGKAPDDADRNSSTCWRRSFPSGQTQKVKPGRVVMMERFPKAVSPVKGFRNVVADYPYTDAGPSV